MKGFGFQKGRLLSDITFKISFSPSKPSAARAPKTTHPWMSDKNTRRDNTQQSLKRTRKKPTDFYQPKLNRQIELKKKISRQKLSALWITYYIKTTSLLWINEIVSLFRFFIRIFFSHCTVCSRNNWTILKNIWLSSFIYKMYAYSKTSL